MTLVLIDEAVASGARLALACDVIGLSARTVERWRTDDEGGRDRRAGPCRAPAHQLSDAEKTAILRVANSPEFRDKSPKQIVPTLADRGEYVASESSFYRVLREHGHAMLADRAVDHFDREILRLLRLDAPPDDLPAEHVHDEIEEVERASHRGAHERDVPAPDLIRRPRDELLRSTGARPSRSSSVRELPENTLVLHADNGGPMKGSTMLATLQRLGIVPSFSRPSVSDDNAFSEALFRTLKYRPSYPRKPFTSLEAARRWVADFIDWYNGEHLHSALRYVTPDARHARSDTAILAARGAVYRAAKSRTPRRWTADIRDWSPVGQVHLNRRHPDLGRTEALH